MATTIIEFFQGIFGNTYTGQILTIFIVSMIPIVELRGAIPVAMQMGLTWYESFGYAFLGSVIVAPILLLILMPILNAMKKIKGFRGIANAVEQLFQSKAESVKVKAGNATTRQKEDFIKIVGVFLFVAVPLPLTGVWTGSAVAVFLGLGFWKSLVAVALGNVSAGLIMTGLSVLFKNNINTFLNIFFLVVLVVLVANIIYLVVKSKIKKKKAASENMVNEDNADIENITNQSNIDKNDKENDKGSTLIDYSNIKSNEDLNDKEQS